MDQNRPSSSPSGRDDGIGAPLRRNEDRRLITGRGRFTDDMTLAGQAYAVFVRSPHPHADIVSIATDDATALAPSVAVLTGAEVEADGLGALEPEFRPTGVDGKPIIAPDRHVLAIGRVRYVGEPVALVVADKPGLARDAAERLEITYRELPFVTDIAAAGDPDSPQIWPEAPGNLAIERHYGDREAVDAAFADAAHTVQLSLANNRLAGNPMEPRTAIAEADPVTGRVTLYCCHQTPHVLRTHIAHVLHLPERQVRIVSRDIGGGFGVRGPSFPEEAAIAWAAGRLGRPIKWTSERSELFLSEGHCRDHVTKLEMALDGDGLILAVRVRDIGNLGAFLSSYGAGPPLIAQALLGTGCYLTGALHGEVRVFFTNTVPLDAYRGAGRPETAYMVERLVDTAARDLGIDPVEFRRRNLIPAERIPYETPTGRVFDSGDFPKNLELATAAVDHARFAARRAASEANGKRRGLGLSLFIDNTGMGPSRILMARGSQFASYESAEVRVDPNGAVTVFTGTHNHGQGHETAFAQLVAERLGTPATEVELRHGDTDQIAYGRGTIGSRSLIAGGGAIEAALDKVVEKAKRIAAHVMECAPDDLEVDRGDFRVAGTDRAIRFEEIAHLAYFPSNYPHEDLEPGLNGVAYWDPKAISFPNGCHACEVEIDPETGKLTIERFVSIDDFGRLINPMIVEGQVHGGIAQGIGQAMLEHCIFDNESGQLITGSFMDYTMPRADDLPRYETGYNHTPTTTNPLGVKGCGESGTVGAPAALVNAVVDALGVRHIDMPLTAEKLWRAARGA